MSKKAYGLTEAGIQLADLPADSSTPAAGAYYSLGKTYKDSATLETAEGSSVECNCEEQDVPEDEISTPGKTTLKFSTTELDPASCHKALGGTLSPEKGEWDAPATIASKEVVLRFTTKTGLQVSCAKAKMSTRINWAIKRDGWGLLEHTLTLLAPLKVVDTAVPEA